MKPNVIVVATLLCFGMAGPANAQNMNAESFHKRAQALKKKGPLALFSRGEIKKLTGEVQAATAVARERRLAAKSAGQTPRYCPPEAGGSMGTTEFMNRLAAIPAADRMRINMTEAMTRILANKFPCRG